MTAVDWGIGRYESTADALLPASETAVEIAAPRRGARVLDIGCGTGNATLLAARAGSDVIGVDPSTRLLGVASRRAADEGLSIDFRQGNAAQLPVDDASVELALSVFAVIFAPEPAAAAAEIARVLAPSGRLVLTAWTPEGAFAETNQLTGRIVRETLGLPEPPAPFPWFKNESVAELFAPHGFSVRTSEHTLAFTAESPEACYALGEENPISVSSREALLTGGHTEQVDRIRTEVMAVLRRRNEDPAALRVTSTYSVHVLDRGGQGGT